VPPGFSTNQLFIAADGSQWVFSAAQNRWISTGVPYNVGAGAAAGAPSAAASAASAAPPTPPIVSTQPPSSYQQIFDWLKESTLTSPLGVSIPNWIVVVVAGGLLVKLSREDRGRR
jgi:hypothetical protein